MMYSHVSPAVSCFKYLRYMSRCSTYPMLKRFNYAITCMIMIKYISFEINVFIHLILLEIEGKNVVPIFTTVPPTLASNGICCG